MNKQLFIMVIIMVVSARTNAQELPIKNHLPIINHSCQDIKLDMPDLCNQRTFDSLLWDEEIKINEIALFQKYPPSVTNNYNNSLAGEIWLWHGGSLYGASEDVSMIGLMRRQGVNLNVAQQYGGFTFRFTLSANRYLLPVDGRLGMMGMNARQNQFGVGAMITYDFSENLSATVYGMYVSNPFYYTMAAFPYIPTSSYGGYITLHNNAKGLDLGVSNHYDPFARRWQTDPIIRPTFKIGKIKTSIDLGPVIKEGMMHLMGKPRNKGPMIMPRK